MDGPPPPPPHGHKPNTTHGHYRKASDLPDGNYDIFIIPPHSAGSGFLYLPSLQCHRNSFIAGSLSTLFAVLLWSTITPLLKTWYATTFANGSGMGITLLAIGVGVAGWAFGASQADNGSPGGPGFGGFDPGPGAGGSGPQAQGQSSRTGGNFFRGSNFGGPHSGQNYGGTNAGGQHGNQYGSRGPNQNRGPGADWDRAREETKRKEEIRRKMEEFKQKREAEAKEKQKREAAEHERRERQAKEAATTGVEKDAETQAKAKTEADAKFAALKEAAAKKYAEKKAKDAQGAAGGSNTPRTPSPKKPPFPTARTATEEDDAYSFRPYDRPRRPYAGATGSMYSESSYAASQSTAPTTPPLSQRGAYSTRDPDKVVIRGVYVFNNAFPKAPIAQLVSGQGMVSDGLVLRITSEGLFIDDDVRGVPQREWDVKAWTMKLAEVWCPQFAATQPRQSPAKTNPFRWGSSQTTPTPEESETYLVNLLKACKNTCRLASPACFSRNGGGIGAGSAEQRALHVLRASLRDQEGKRYVFVLQETEGWKVAIGLQRLRQGTQARALGVSGMTMNDCKSVLGNLGYV